MKGRGRSGFRRKERSLRQREARVDSFLRRAPRLLEEERNTIPPPEEFAARPGIVVPTRAEFIRVRRQYYLRGIRLVITVLAFGVAAVWFVQQLMRHTYLFD
ncbi:MAG TPA: hypothetical protein VMN36_18390 [Verrucomicrobiales bacterium]|nr:hypothetical protein [Verrucomicrobiales bacterium]